MAGAVQASRPGILATAPLWLTQSPTPPLVDGGGAATGGAAPAPSGPSADGGLAQSGRPTAPYVDGRADRLGGFEEADNGSQRLDLCAISWSDAVLVSPVNLARPCRRSLPWPFPLRLLQ
jgi:hypothetical protein